MVKEHDLFKFIRKKKKSIPGDQFDTYVRYVNDTIRLNCYAHSFSLKVTETNYKVVVDTDAIFDSVLYFLKNAEAA